MNKATRFLLTPSLLAALFFASSAPSSAFLDKTRFAAHLGIAYYCFHHWVLNPYREGKFAGDAPHRTASLVKAGAALLFAVHQVKTAQKIAVNSKDPTLHRLSGGVGAAGGLGALAGSFGAIGERLKSGQFSAKDVTDLASQTTTVGSEAAANGAPIKDVPVSVPGM